MPMQTTVMIKANKTQRMTLVGLVFPSCRPSVTPQTIPAAPPPKKVITGAVLPFFAPKKIARMVNRTGASSMEKKTSQLVFTGGN